MIALPLVPFLGLFIVALLYGGRRLAPGRLKLLLAILTLAAIVQTFTSLAHALLPPRTAMQLCAVVLQIVLIAAAYPALKRLDRDRHDR
jgi:hypothetical protein